MNIGIVGAGASGLFLGALIKKYHSTYDVVIFEKNDKIGKKLYATGNGRCNIGNLSISKDTYSNSDFVKKVSKNFTISKEIDFFASIGIPLVNEGDLLYPYSKSAKNFVTLISEFLNSQNVEFILNAKIDNYELKNGKIIVKNNDKTYIFDKFIIASGGKSSPAFGSDGNIFNILKNRGYKITKCYPGLCPLKTKETNKDIEGVRNDSMVYIYKDKSLIHSEEGEVLFKKDGLSGIVIMNASSIIARLDSPKDIEIVLDLLPNLKEEEIVALLVQNKKIYANPLYSLLNSKLADYIFKRFEIISLNEKNILFIAKQIKHLEYTFADFYSFNDSQVTVGGIDISCLSDSLESITEKNVFFAGEIINIDGLCGGFNLMWALTSANAIAEVI